MMTGIPMTLGAGPVFQAGTLQVHCKEMDKVPCMYPPGTSQVHSEFSLPMFLQFPWPGGWPVHSQCPGLHDCDVPINYIMGTSWIFPKNVTAVFLSGSFKDTLAVCSQCPRSCDWDVPIGKVMGTSWIFPKKVPVMSLSGSFKEFFAVFPVVWSQCSQPVKPKMSQNGVLEVNQSGTFWMCPSRQPQCTTFGKIRETLGTLQGNVKKTRKPGTFWTNPVFFQSFPNFFYQKWCTGVVWMGTFKMCHFGSPLAHHSGSF